jgi:hypothetical protein
MRTYIHGRNYNFEIVLESGRKDSCFYIRAICKYSKRTSCINNLNIILSELNVDIDAPKYQDSSWLVTKREAKNLAVEGKSLLFDSSFRDYIESRLDEDRAQGEWENIAG